MSILNLDNKSSLYFCFPQNPEFVEDEVEIWLDSSEEKICLLKDSLHYVVVMEAAQVVQHLERQVAPTNRCFPKLFVDYCLGKSMDHSYINHLFGDYQCNTTWLTKNNNGDVVLEIWKTDPFSTPVICEMKYSFTISYNEFAKWWNQLISKDQLS